MALALGARKVWSDKWTTTVLIFRALFISMIKGAMTQAVQQRRHHFA
jgi:hypothetical protein